jgi:hypothetical protein
LFSVFGFRFSVQGKGNSLAREPGGCSGQTTANQLIHNESENRHPGEGRDPF